MDKEKWVVEVYAGKEFVGKMTGVDGKVAVFDQREQAITEAQKFKAKGTLGIWCKVVQHLEEQVAASH
ncbi:hypothetical protein [Bacillus inaquosorum]|uniref:hypothetical protein n=1 Tax=Bacillus TaxID=1386 RepID=UPI00227F4450|nr:hypothetical protein [Bacillus inaquosorum]MCY7768189.1 hypothetical protein [Bacillus inaquosorum]MCY9099569.1 hypothetical protein [Bacillus inaquosorum]MCY9377220.1 hypothetical protein [Bacillus sp. T17B1]